MMVRFSGLMFFMLTSALSSPGSLHHFPRLVKVIKTQSKRLSTSDFFLGLSTALVERDDFSSGTSSRSTKLIHGGVRYLQKAIMQLDREQVR